MADVPENSHFRFTLLVSFSTWSARNKEHEGRAWFWNGFHTYLLLHDETQVSAVRAKMKGFIDRNIEKGGMHYEDLPLQALTDIYLKETPRSWENGKRGNLSNLYILSLIALFILVIASFNYVNLATARASRRFKEVGLRKVLGARRRTLITQFLGESFLVSLLATALGAGAGQFYRTDRYRATAFRYRGNVGADTGLADGRFPFFPGGIGKSEPGIASGLILCYHAITNIHPGRHMLARFF